jgi:GDP/UDP-N,N'-diacetylbacillosamine 2-epimerase (hydrolysing)
MRKICVVTGTRAEYGLLSGLMKKIAQDSSLELQILATGMHLSPEFGLTYKAIEEDGFRINKKVEMLLSSDTEIGITKSIGLGLIGFADAFQELKPDLLVLLGDRFEAFAAASAAMISKVPIGHLHGGETTEGAFDESIRHAITKMSQLHFTACEEYRNRVIQLGEHPDRVYNFGAIGIDNIVNTKLMHREEFEESIGFKLGAQNIVATFHPVTLDDRSAEFHFHELLSALNELPDLHIIFTKPNADAGGRRIIGLIDKFVSEHSQRSCSFISLGQMRYLSALKFVDAVVGNSSSGLIEAPSFQIGTINIGDRQKGRLQAANVIQIDPDKNSILKGFNILYSENFKKTLKSVENPFGMGGVATKIHQVISEISLDNILKKKFFNFSYDSNHL